MKGSEENCICERPKGKHRKYCDAYRLSEFLKKVARNFGDPLHPTVAQTRACDSKAGVVL